MRPGGRNCHELQSPDKRAPLSDSAGGGAVRLFISVRGGRKPLRLSFFRPLGACPRGNGRNEKRMRLPQRKLHDLRLDLSGLFFEGERGPVGSAERAGHYHFRVQNCAGARHPPALRGAGAV